MGKRQKLTWIIIVGLAALFFMNNVFYQSLKKKNVTLRSNYREIRKKVKMVERFPENQLLITKGKLNQINKYLAEKIPSADQDWDIVGQLTQGPVAKEFSFEEISSRSPREQDGYQSSTVDITTKITLYQLLRYLEEIDQGPLLIGVDKIEIKRADLKDPDILEIKASFSGYQATQKKPSAKEYLEKDFTSIDIRQIDALLDSLKPEKRTLDLSWLEEFDPFGGKITLTTPVKRKPEPTPKEPEEVSLKFKGIAQAGDQKAALINDKVVKIGDMIDGMKVEEIHRFKVILSKNNKRYILELGKDEPLK